MAPEPSTLSGIQASHTTQKRAVFLLFFSWLLSQTGGNVFRPGPVNKEVVLGNGIDTVEGRFFDGLVEGHVKFHGSHHVPFLPEEETVLAVFVGGKVDFIDMLVLVPLLHIVPDGSLDDFHDPIIQPGVQNEEFFLEIIIGKDDALPIAIEGVALWGKDLFISS